MSERIVRSFDNVSTAGGVSQASVVDTGPIPTGMRLAVPVARYMHKASTEHRYG